MKKIIGIMLCVAILIAGICFWQYKENKRIDLEAITLKENLSVEFGKKAKVSDFIENLNGTLLEDKTVDTEKLGESQVSFEYKNIKNKTRTAQISIQVVDKIPPQILSGNSYTVKVGYEKDLADVLLSRR